VNSLRLMLPDYTQLDDECATGCGTAIHVGALICEECSEQADTEADLRYERSQDWSGDE
jgi:hypothetical protein